MKFQINKKLLLSAVLAVGGFMASGSAVAYPTDAELHNNSALCSYGYNPNCGGSNGGYGGGYNVYYHTDYLAILHDKDNKPYFFKKRYRKYDQVWRNEYWKEADADALADCNASKKAPCNFRASVIHDGCIAYLIVPDGTYSIAADTCAEAKKQIQDACLAKETDKTVCKGIKTKKP